VALKFVRRMPPLAGSVAAGDAGVTDFTISSDRWDQEAVTSTSSADKGNFRYDSGRDSCTGYRQDLIRLLNVSDFGRRHHDQSWVTST